MTNASSRGERAQRNGAEMVADLNDLIQLDHDAVEGYTLAIDTIANDRFREQLVEFRADHKRHIEELAALVRAVGSVAVELPHLPSGPFKLAVQAAGVPGGDAGILLAFKANEAQVRDKYRSYERYDYPDEVDAIIRRAAEDETRHYQWVAQTLEELGYGERTFTGQAEQAFETVHKTLANAVESAEKQAMKVAEAIRGGLRDGSR